VYDLYEDAVAEWERRVAAANAQASTDTGFPPSRE
jgi:hypothetical protein